MPDFPRVPLHPQGFDENRPYDTTFSAYPAAHHGSHPPGPVQTYATHMTPISYGSHTPAPYDGQAAYLAYRPPPPPPSTFHVLRYSPTHGRPGTQLTFHISANWDIMANSNSASVRWGDTRKFSATMSRDNSQQQDDKQYHFILSSQVPQLPDISEWVSEVPIMVVIDSPNGEEYTQDVGNFTYEQEFANREPLRMGQEDIPVRQGYRGSNMELRNEMSEYQPYQPMYSSYRPQYSMSAPYENLPAQSHMGQQFPASSMQQQHPQPLIPWSNQGRNNSVPTRQLPHITPPNPRLVRTSTLDTYRTPLGQSAAGTGAYYHQAMKPPSVHLRFEGDLEGIGRTDRWSADQLRLSRRVVYFSRRQSGAEIFLKFWVARVDEIGGGGSIRPQAAIPLSCILWGRKSQCFVTSVDTIALLEWIMAQKFPTEEKNRIRRNLEHFKPVTVRKPTPGSGHGSDRSEDTSEIFTTIMGFGAPKPRNIEKDIKVFRWKDLKSALLKITGKYSCKPTAQLPPPQQHYQQPPPLLMTPASSIGGNSGYSLDNTGLYVHSNDRGAPTTRSISGQQNGYAPASFAGPSSSGQRLNSPPYGRTLSLRGINEMHHHQGSLHQMATFEQSQQQHWPTTPTHHMPAPAPHPPSQYGTPRPSWDLGMGSALPAFPEGTSGAAGAGPGELAAHQQGPSPRTAPPGDGQGGGEATQDNGQLRHHGGAPPQ